MPIWTDRQTTVGPVEYGEAQADLRAAYNRGREDERRNRQHHPLIAIAVVILALIGAWLLFLAAREGSFSSAGVVADQNISSATQEAGPALRDTGQAIKQAGTDLKDKSQDAIQNRDQTPAPAPASPPAR